MFLSSFSVLTLTVEANDVVPYDNIGTEWTRNPNLIMSAGAWDSRVWQWSTTSLELQHSDGNNYVKWNIDGQVESQAQDELGGSYKASNFDQGYERYENEIYDLGDWSNKANSLRVEGSVTVFDDVGYTGSSRAFTSDVSDLGAYGWASTVSSLKLSRGSRVTLYSSTSYSGNSKTCVFPSYQPPDLKVSDKRSITLEGVVSNWYTDAFVVAGWTGAKFDIFAVEDRYSGAGTLLMLEMYFLRGGLNLAWSSYNSIPGCSGNEREGFRGPPYQSAYNYLVALEDFPEIATMTTYPGNMAKWTIDVKALIQRACDHDWGVSPSTYHLDINKLKIVKVSFTVESAHLGSSARASCTLNRLRLAYTGAADAAAATVYSENAYDKYQNGVSWSKVSDSSSLSGFAMKAATSSPNGGVLFGPYITQGSDGSILAGKPYTAIFKLKVSSNVLNDNVVYLDVCYNAGTVIKSSLLRASDFSASNVWQSFELPFVAPSSMVYGLEFRVNNQNSGAIDIFVDDISLHRDWSSSTIYFEGALSKPQSGSSWILVSDPSAYYEQVRKAPSSAQNYACLYGPYIKNVAETELNGLPLVVSFRLKVSSNVQIKTVARIDVAFNAGTVIQSEQIRASDFTSPNSWQEFAMSITVPDTLVYGLEFRVFNVNNGVADLFVDGISVAQDSSVVYSESASDKPTSGTSWATWSDQTSLSGTVMRASSASSNGGVLYGPYIKTDEYGADMQGAAYTVRFRMKISSNAATANVAYLDVCYNLGVAVLAQKSVKASDFDSPNTWQTFQLTFDVPTSMTYGLEFRVTNLNNAVADVYVDEITVSTN